MFESREFGLKADFQPSRAGRFTSNRGTGNTRLSPGNEARVVDSIGADIATSIVAIVGTARMFTLVIQLFGILVWVCRPPTLAARDQDRSAIPVRFLTLKDVRDLTSAQLSNAPVCDIQGVVTYCDAPEGTGFIHDGTDELFFSCETSDLTMRSGDVVRFRGNFANGRYSPIILVKQTEHVGHSLLPTPLVLSYDQLFRGDGDARWIKIQTQILSIEQEGAKFLLSLCAPGGLFKCLASADAVDTDRITLGAEVRLTGVAGSIFDRNGKFVSIQLLVPTRECIELINPRNAELRNLPLSLIGSILTYRHRPVSSSTNQAPPLPERIRGTVTCFPGNRSFFIQDASGGIEAYLQTDDSFPAKSIRSKVAIGDSVELIGFSIRELPSVRFLFSEIRTIREKQSIQVVKLDGMEPDDWPSGVLVDLTATFTDRVNQSPMALGILETSNHVTLETRQFCQPRDVNWWNKVRKDSLVSVRGVLEFQPPRPGRVVQHTLWLRSPEEIEVRKAGFFLTGRQAQDALVPVAIGWFLAIGVVGFMSWRMSVNHRLIKKQYLERHVAEGKYQSLVRQSIDPIFSFDLEGRLTENNPAVETLTGWTAEELRGRRLVDLINPSQDTPVLEPLTALQRGESTSTLVVGGLRTKAGDSIPIELGLQRVELPKAEPFIHGFGRDIRSRLEIARKLREQEEGQQALIDSLNEGVLKVDQSGKVQAFNPSALKVLGLDSETLRAFNFREARSELTDAEGNPIPPMEFPLEHTFATGEGCSGKVFGTRRADGQQQWFLISTSPIQLGPTGAVEVAVVSITDFTLQQRAKLELVQAREVAEASNKAKTEFLAVMSHEIRTPLNGVIGFTDLLLNTTLDESSRRFAETIRESGEALLSVVNEILDFSKIEAGRLELEYEVFPLLHTVEEVINNNSARAGSKKLELIVDVSPEVGPEWAGDRGRLRQILTNLVGNAVKFTEHGSVELVIEALPDRGLEFQVRDTGPGMSPAEAEKLFVKFSQVRRSALPTEGGTGLGLSIVKQLVELMGGSVGCSSSPGVGSVFWFRLPPPKDGVISTSPIPAPPEMGNSRLLLISNSPSIRRALTRRLDAWKFSVDVLTETNQLVEKLRDAFENSNPYDVVLVDYSCLVSTGERENDHLPELSEFGPPAIIYLCGRDQHPRFLNKRNSHAILWKPAVFPDSLRQALLTAWVGSRLKASAPDSSAQEVKPRILVVEDDRVSAMLAAYLLNGLGCDVQIASSGEEALSFCRDESYDLIFLDGTLPGMDGPTAARKIRAGQGRYRQVPIIAVTGSVRPEDERRYRAAGMDGVLAKPLRSEELKSALSGWIVLPQEAKLT